MADTLQQLLRERADQDTVAVKYGEMTRTWRQYVAEARAQAAALIGQADPPVSYTHLTLPTKA